MQIQDQITELYARIGKAEQELSLLQIKTDNQESQIAKIEAAFTALTNMRVDMTNIQRDMAVNAARQEATTKAYSWMVTSAITLAGTIIFNWQTIKGFFQ